MRKHDWADTMARQIAADYGVQSDRLKYDLVAARLHVVRQEGIGEGIEQCKKAVAPKGEPDAG
jgi:hypothetical protein